MRLKYDLQPGKFGPGVLHATNLIGFFVVANEHHIFIAPCWPLTERCDIAAVERSRVKYIRVMHPEKPVLKDSKFVAEQKLREVQSHKEIDEKAHRSYVGDADAKAREEYNKSLQQRLRDRFYLVPGEVPNGPLHDIPEAPIIEDEGSGY